MREISNFTELHAALAKFVPPARSMRGAYTLERMRVLMEYLGNPQDNYKAIHVAGTSGKTSTCYYITSLLKQAGCKVGLTVSPHISEVNDRVQINLEPLPEKIFCKEFSLFLGQVEQSNVNPTYFELLVAFAYWEFDRQEVDYAVIEVGLGGLLDGTNVISRADKTCVITDIGLDHVDVLGQTIPEITAQKAGIIQPHNAVVMYEQGDVVMDVVREICEQIHGELHEVWELQPSQLPKNLVLFQRRNWYLALMAYDYLSKRDCLPELGESQLAESTAVAVPARMETFIYKDKTIILDGAHNAQKMHALAISVHKAYGKQSVALLISLVQSKNFKIRTSLQEVLATADHAIITGFDTTQDMRKQSVKPVKIAEHCLDLGFDSIDIVEDPQTAFKRLLDRPEPVLLVTGSFYLLNHIRPLVLKLTKRASAKPAA
jgi:dihydrofolate synthase / folylpolyglutamate synthase